MGQPLKLRFLTRVLASTSTDAQSEIGLPPRSRMRRRLAPARLGGRAVSLDTRRRALLGNRPLRLDLHLALTGCGPDGAPRGSQRPLGSRRGAMPAGCGQVRAFRGPAAPCRRPAKPPRAPGPAGRQACVGPRRAPGRCRSRAPHLVVAEDDRVQVLELVEPLDASEGVVIEDQSLVARKVCVCIRSLPIQRSNMMKRGVGLQGAPPCTAPACRRIRHRTGG